MAAILTNAAATLFTPCGLDMGDAGERYASMSVSRNPFGATVEIKPRPMQPREFQGNSDISGSRPKSLPPFQRKNFHDNFDVDGSHSKPLHTLHTGHVDILAIDDIEGVH
jgi:hypothetical protein